MDAETGKARFRVPAFRREVGAVAFSRDGRLVATATGKLGPNRKEAIAAPSEVVIWDATTGKEVARLTDKESIRDYTALAFSPDGSFLVAQTKWQAGWSGVHGLGAPAAMPEPVKDNVFDIGRRTGQAGGALAPAVSAAPEGTPRLVRDLSAAGVTDGRRVEALFLAALGRFPTDVEARTLVAQIARREDKAATALRGPARHARRNGRVFAPHAEELGRMAK